MKILFTGLFPIWQCHLVGECNFMEEHILAGDEVDLLTCDASLNACDANPDLELHKCFTCIGIRDDAAAMLSSLVRKRPLVGKSSKREIKEVKIPVFRNMDELRSFRCFDAPVGSDVISSVMTALGDPDFDTIVNAERIKKTIIDYLGVYLTSIEYIKTNKYSLVYIFNGRFATAKAIIRACETTNTDYYTMERLAMPDRVQLIKNDTAHDFSAYPPWIYKFWESQQNNPEIIKEAVDFFEERPTGNWTGWYSYVTGQEKSLLPEGWHSQKRNIAIFSSTESEFAGIPKVFNGALFVDQRSCYLRIAELIHEKNPSICFNLRIHPNSAHEKTRWWEDIKFQKIPNMRIIPPESPVSSYALMRSCEKTVVFMTTMGIEATYWGKPSILLSNAFYKGIGAVYEPTSEEEAIQLILDETLQPKSREITLAYGGFMRMGYPKLPYSECLDHCTLTFKGVRPNAHQKILKSLWRYDTYIDKWPLPKFIKKIYQNFEWYRLKYQLSGDFSDRCN